MPLRKRITRQELQDKIGEYNIFAYYFGENFILHKGYNSVLRQDDRKSTSFFITENGTLLYNDFALGKKYDFVQFVMEKFGLKYYAALEQIAADFGLIKGSLTGNTIAKIKPIKQAKKPIKRQIKANVQTFKKHHLDYWSQYHITPQELKENNVYAITTFSVDGFTIPYTNELRFLFIIKDFNADGELEHYCKFYTPYSKEFKWVSYCPLKIMFGFNELPFKSDTLLICKSQKERIIAKKIFSDVVSLQSENKGSIDPAKFEFLKTKYKRIIYFGDNDKPGLRFCEYVKNEYNIETFNFPELLLTKHKVKDIGDFVTLWGVDNLKLYFIQNKILL